jgi:hypothetical protein
MQSLALSKFRNENPMKFASKIVNNIIQYLNVQLKHNDASPSPSGPPGIDLVVWLIRTTMEASVLLEVPKLNL